MENLSSKIVKTRTPHECWGCGREFPRGSVLRVVVSADDGTVTRSYWCGVCDVLVDEMDDCDGFLEGEALSNDPDHWHEIARMVAETGSGLTTETQEASHG